MAFGAACGFGVYVCSSDWCGLNLGSESLSELGAEGWQKAGVVVVVVDEVGRGGSVMDLWEPSLGSGTVQLTDRYAPVLLMVCSAPGQWNVSLCNLNLWF